MCIQKILNVNLIYFSSLTSIPQFIWQDLAIAGKSSKVEKSMCYLLKFDEWTENDIEESVLQKEVFFKSVALQSIKLFVLSRSLKKYSEEAQFYSSCWPIVCNFINKNRTISKVCFMFHVSFSTDL